MPDGSLTRRRQHASSSGDVPDEMTSEAIRARCMQFAPRNNTLHRQPVLRQIYLAYFLLSTLLFLVPFWLVYYVPQSNRPRKSWTVKKCVRVGWSRRLCGLVAFCEIDYLGSSSAKRVAPESLTHSHPVMMPSAPPDWLRGHPAEMLRHLHSTRGKWHPQFIYRPSRSGPWGKWNPPAQERQEYGFTTVPGFWYCGRKEHHSATRPARKQGEPVLLLFHGGGYVVGSAAEHDMTSNIAKSMVNHTPVNHVLSVDYRLAGAAPWPLPLLDAITAYAYLISEGVDERDLLVGGDSAGGHLALALTRWLRDEGRVLGLQGPRAVLTFSPWCDLGFTQQWEPEGLAHNRGVDTIEDTFGVFAVSLLLRGLPESTMHDNVYVSPAGRLIPATRTGPTSFEDFPPLFVVHGDAERIGPEITELFHRVKLSRPAGSTVPDHIITVPDAVHDFLIFPWFGREAAEVYEELDEWLRNLLSEEDSDDDEFADIADMGPLALPSPIMDAPDPIPSPRIRPSPRSPHITMSPLSPLSPLSPFSPFLRAERRAHRSDRLALRAHRSPRMLAQPDSPAAVFEDMRSDGINLINLDVPALDLGAAVGHAVGSFTAQYHDEEGEKYSDGESE